MGKILKTIHFLDLPTEIEGGKIRAKRFYKDKEEFFSNKIKENIKNGIYIYTAKEPHFLINAETKKIVVKNFKTVGKIRIIPINAQLLNTSALSAFYDVGKIKKLLTKYFLEQLKDNPLLIVSYPLYIEFKYFLKAFKINRDLDNFKGLYEKVFLDCIQKLKRNKFNMPIDNPKGFIINDSIEYINKVSHEIILNPNLETNSLIIKFYKNKQ